MDEAQSNSFNFNFMCMKIFGIWPGKSPSITYKLYSGFYLSIFLIIYNGILTVNLFFVPLKVESIIEDAMFYFNVVSITTKVATILRWQKEIFALLKILDCESFKGKDSKARDIVRKGMKNYNICWKLYALLCNFSFLHACVLPVILHLIFSDYEIKLPVSKYHFLSHETRQKYFWYIYCYQVIGIYGQMTYNINIDSFYAGMLYYSIIQMRLLSHELRNLKRKREIISERAQLFELNYCLRHYETIIRYCDGIQDIFSLAVFVQFGMASVIICAVLCALLLSKTEIVFKVTYLTGMTSQIFVPAWLGTQLINESKNFVFAMYESDWLWRDERYKKSVKLFMTRANTPVVMAGMKMFTLNLETFVAIMKTAYSFLTLLRNVQEENEDVDSQRVL